MLKTKKVINSVNYLMEVWGKIANGRYTFGIQAIPIKGQIYPFRGYVSEEFIEDFIDNDKKEDFLEKVTLRVADNHLGDMMKLSPRAVAINVQWWFKEAKKQIEDEIRETTELN